MWPFKPNDWKPVFIAEPDEYTVTTTYADIPLERTKHHEQVYHTLYYSKSRNKYRITCSGYHLLKGKELSPSYIACVKKQIELSNI